MVVICAAYEPARAGCTPDSPCTSGPTNIGTPSGAFLSEAFAISGDGSTVVGEAVLGFSGLSGFRWTSSSGGMQDLGNLGGFITTAYGVSYDGSVIVGESQTGCGCFHAFRWTAAGGMEDLGTLTGGFNSTALGVSGDGLVVVGVSDTTPGDIHAFRWTRIDGMVDLNTLGGFYSAAYGTNYNGSVVVGESSIFGDIEIHAFRWTLAGGMIDLGTLGGPNSSAYATNSDGSVVVGESDVAGFGSHAFRWTSAGGMQDLGTLGGANSAARAVSANGAIVVGESEVGCGCLHAFRWTAVTGMKDLNTLLANAGVNMAGIELMTANGISGDGQFIVGAGDFFGEYQAYIVRYDDGIAGVTTRGAVQQSINELADARAGVMAQQHGFAAPLLGGDKPMGSGNEAGVFASAGSAAGGGFVRYSTGLGVALLGGISYARESYPDAELKHGGTGALALQYMHDSAGWWRPFIETGGWMAPNAALSFSRTYANGAGTATGTGQTNGDLSYLYARAGVLLSETRADQIVFSAEFGRERMAVDAYAEPLTLQNPFEAHVAGGTDKMDLAKVKVQWSHQLSSSLDTTLWVAGAHGFNRTSELSAFVPGIGVLAPANLDARGWAEYGARVGYKLTDTITLDAFTNGVSGRDGIDTRVHGGFALRFQY